MPRTNTLTRATLVSVFIAPIALAPMAGGGYGGMLIPWASGRNTYKLTTNGDVFYIRPTP